MTTIRSIEAICTCAQRRSDDVRGMLKTGSPYRQQETNVEIKIKIKIKVEKEEEEKEKIIAHCILNELDGDMRM